ncbi:MAG: glycosyltransferase [Acidobacteriota bacterium]|nr:glycosyltransferase [Acidobacteriota bacterium]
MTAALYWVVVTCLAYLCIVYLVSLALLAASLAEHAYRIRRDLSTNDDTLLESAFAIPVSVLAPVYNEASIIVHVVETLLAQNYPQHEVIVINDGSTDDTMQVLTSSFELEPRSVFYRRVLDTAQVRCTYVSRRHPNLIVVDKDNGGKADALNCGVNLARYRYVCTVDGDTIYEPNALENGMRAAQQNPEHVIGVTSAVAIRRDPEAGRRFAFGVHRIDVDPLTNFQLLEFFRSFLTTRMGAGRWGFMLCASGAFALWRRDVLIELCGFSSDFTCEDIEFTFRAHETFRRMRRPYRILALGSVAGTTESPASLRDLIVQRARWQRVILETVWAYRRMLFNPRYGSAGMAGLPYYVISEVSAPFFQCLAAVAFVTAWALGQLDMRALQLILILALGNGILTNVALMLQDSHSRAYPMRDLVQLVLLGPLDLLLYRPIMFVAQTKGFVDFLRGDKAWHKSDRRRRASQTSATP